LHSDEYYIFEWWWGPPNIAGPGVVCPLYPTLLTGLVTCSLVSDFNDAIALRSGRYVCNTFCGWTHMTLLFKAQIPLRQLGKVAHTNGDKLWNRWLSVKVTDTNHESQWHDLCRGLSWFVSATFSAGKFRWKSQSRCSGIWALPDMSCPVSCYGVNTIGLF